MIEIVAEQVWLVAGATDMRKSIDGLAGIVSYGIQQNPLSRQLFVFCNKDRNKLKILFWDQNGFWLFYKRLEKGKFLWPVDNTQATHCISRRQLGWLLDGLSFNQKLAHKTVSAQIAI